ncbi:MAG: ROK family protein [Saprospiraceae bacterium]|nr:ROK family protein [Saprospiraceae bacterium]
MKEKNILGIDVGGTGIKLGVVDLSTGKLITERLRRKTPPEAHPRDVLKVIRQGIKDLDYSGPIGIGFPAKIINGYCKTAVNVSSRWLDFDLHAFFEKELGEEIRIANDADVAGMAEYQYGTTGMKDYDQVLFLTVGTGIGSALFVKGHLVRNTELGLMKYKKNILELHASNRIRSEKELSWSKWGKRLNNVMHYLHRVITLDLIVMGGGVSKQFEKYEKHLDLEIPVRPASLKNEAGVIGAALLWDEE